MKTIIAGSRTVKDGVLIEQAVKESGFNISKVLCGGAKGADVLGRNYAKSKGIPVLEFPADWAKFGNGAGIIRNVAMANNAEALIAIWDGQSRGTRHMIDEAKKRNLKVYIKIIEKEKTLEKNI
jgi:hypothetical protein